MAEKPKWELGFVLSGDPPLEPADEAFMSFGEDNSPKYCEATFRGTDAKKHATVAAAALELLSALQGLVAICRPGGEETEARRRYDAAHAAIAKAIGG